MPVLAADVGGTSTRLALFDDDRTLVRDRHYASAEHVGFEAIARDFLGQSSVTAIGVGVAGPVANGRAKTTNLPWELDSARLAESLGAERVTLVNDFEAVALGIAALDDDELLPMKAGDSLDLGARLIVGAGTGLGVAVIAGRSLPSEGGHIGFAPRDARDAALWQFAREETPAERLSAESFVSGPGLARVFRFHAHEAGDDAAGAKGGDIARAAAGGDPIARAALEHFVSLYGAVCGDLALVVVPEGGLYVAGGIAPKLRTQMGARFDELFLEAFGAKGPMSRLLQTVAVTLITNPRVGLLGAREAAFGATL